MASTPAPLPPFASFLPSCPQGWVGVGGGVDCYPQAPSLCWSWESHSSAFHSSSGLTAALEHWSCWFLSTWSGAAVDAFIFVSVLFSVVQVGKLGIIFNSSLSHPSKPIHQKILLALPSEYNSNPTTSPAAALSKPLSSLT